MPEEFDRCYKGGGKVFTKTLPGNKYIHICKPKGGGPTVSGEVKKKKIDGFLKRG